MKYKIGNILESDTEALINTVNTFGVMGKGIALAFKRSFPSNYSAYRKAYEAGELCVGKMFVHETGQISPKFVINFPTKKHWRNKSQMSYIEEGLDDLIQVIEHYKIKSISIPPLGCGLGGLRWSEVKILIESKLSHLSNSVNIIIFEPGYKSAVTKVKSIDKLTATRAMYLSLLRQYQMLGEEITTLVVQKLAYFLQLTGEDLKLNFEKGKYGPFSPTLNKMLEAFSPNYLKYRGDLNNPYTSLRLESGKYIETDQFIKVSLSEDQKSRLENIQSLIEGFETAFGLELLATVAYAKKSCPECTKEEIVSDIHLWNERKAATMNPRMIEVCYDRLAKFGLA